MKKPMYSYMQVGLIHFMAYPETMKGEGPILETLKKICTDDYFTAVEISWIKDPQVRRQAKQMLDTSGMTVAYGGQPRLLTTGLNINDLNEAGRLQAVDTLKAGMDEAYEMGAVGFAYLSGKYQEEKKDAAFQALVQSSRALCAYAKEKGNMRVVLEVFDYDVDKKSLIGPAYLAKRLAAVITREFNNFGLMVDLSHLPLIRETLEEAILPIREYIVHAHMGNCVVRDPALPAYGDAHPRFGFPNSENGVEELVEYLRILKGIGFINQEKPPIVSFEVKPFEGEDPDIVIANAKRTLNMAWGRV